MKILAIDLDSQGGFVVYETNLRQMWCDWLTLPQSARKGEMPAQFWGRRFDRMVDILTQYSSDAVLFETSDWHRPIAGLSENQRMAIEAQNRNVARALGRLEGLLVSACRVMKVPVEAVAVHAAKKAAVKNGNATKKMILDWARREYPSLGNWGDPKMQTIADALSVLRFRLLQSDPLLEMRK